MTKTRVTDYDLVDHGIDGSQYFQGCGVAFTRFEHVVTGAGDNFAEAVEDALECMAQDGVDTEALEKSIIADLGTDILPSGPSVTDEFRKYNPDAKDEDGDWDYDGCDLYYYMSIRYNL